MSIVFRDGVRRYFLDTEFIEDGRTIDLLSVAVVPDFDGGPEFYLCNAEADQSRADDWVRAHVLPHLPPPDSDRWATRATIREALERYLGVGAWHRDENPKLKLWAYYASYDHVALCQLWGRMVDLPKGMPMYTMDLKQLSVMVGSPRHPDQDPATAHDALADARWNRTLFRMLRAHADRSERETVTRLVASAMDTVGDCLAHRDNREATRDALAWGFADVLRHNQGVTPRLVWVGKVCGIVSYATTAETAGNPSDVCIEGEREPCCLCEHDDCCAEVVMSTLPFTPGHGPDDAAFADGGDE